MKVTDLLRTMDIFEHLPSEEREKIARLLRERRLMEGQVLCRQGEPGETCPPPRLPAQPALQALPCIL